MLTLKLHLGDEDEINRHVSFRYRYVSYQLEQSRARLDQICEILKAKNPTLIQQINKQRKKYVDIMNY